MYVEYSRYAGSKYQFTCFYLTASNPPMPTASCVWLVPNTVDPMEN